MKRFSVILDLIMAKYVAEFDWWAMIFVPLLYGIVLIKNTSVIWSMYEFNNLFLNLALPDMFGVIFIAVAILMFIAKKINNKKAIALALALSSFAWSIIGVMFIFAIPSNGVWILCGDEDALVGGVEVDVGDFCIADWCAYDEFWVIGD